METTTRRAASCAVWRRFAVAIALACLGPAAALATNAAAPIAIGPKGAGRGGTEVAVGDSALSQAVNPALATELRGTIRLDGMFGWLITRSRFQNDLNDDLSTSFDTVLGAGAVSWDTRYPGAGRLRVGLSVFVPVGGGGESKIVTPVFPEGTRDASSFFFLNIMPSVAFEASPKLSFGAGLNLLYLQLSFESVVGTNDNSGGKVFQYWDANGTPISPPRPFEVQGQQVTWAEVFALAGTEDANESSRVRLDGGRGLGIGATVGLLWKPDERWRVGLSYRTPGFVPSTRGTARIDASRSIQNLQSDPQLSALLGGLLETYLPDRGQNGFRSDYDFEIRRFDQPAVLQGGLSLQLLETWMVALDLRYIFWKDAFGEKDVVLRNGSNADINAINGSDEIRDKKLLRWRNQFVIGLGTAFALPELTGNNVVFRLGYNYGRNPQPAETFTPNTGIVEHHITVGGSYYTGAWDFDFAYVYAFPNEIDVGPGESKSASAFNDSATRAEQHFLYFGLGYRF